MLMPLRIAGANYDMIRKVVRTLDLDTSHGTGPGHRKGSHIPMSPLPRRPLHLVGGRNKGKIPLR